MSKCLNDKQGSLLVFLGGLAWGFSGACGEYILNNRGLSVDILIPLRLLLAGLATLFYCKISKIDLAFGVFKNKFHLLRLLAFGFFGIFFCQYFYFYGISLSNAAIATVIQYTAPAFIILIVCIEERKKPNLYEILSLFFVVFGILLLATNGDFTKFAITPKALFVCSLSVIGVVCYSLIPRKLNKIYSPLPILGYAMLIMGIVLCLKEQIWNKSFYIDLNLFLAMFSVIIIGTVFAFGTYMIGLNIIGATKASLIASVEPVGAAIIAYLWLGTSLDFIQIIGFILIMSAVFLTIIRK
ncbi:DMT family transporter [Campylobacter sp. MG1]|uniref:DMT family transporter n=1 Tax=Campylobacter sp. MG1 TaxID=2976332 RepID=UPI00226C6770|nr:EamA family transporter [Campylobacter sp. MG1]